MTRWSADFVASMVKRKTLHAASDDHGFVRFACLGRKTPDAVLLWDYRYRGGLGTPTCRRPECRAGFAYLDANP